MSRNKKNKKIIYEELDNITENVSTSLTEKLNENYKKYIDELVNRDPRKKKIKINYNDNIKHDLNIL